VNIHYIIVLSTFLMLNVLNCCRVIPRLQLISMRNCQCHLDWFDTALLQTTQKWRCCL